MRLCIISSYTKAELTNGNLPEIDSSAVVVDEDFMTDLHVDDD
jgi:hypothetical protein